MKEEIRMGAEKSRDLIKLDKEKMSEKLSVAMKSENTEEAAKAMTEFADMIQQSIISEARALNAESAADKSILAARGVRQLTSTEQKYFEQAIEAMKGDNVKQALTNIEVAMPITYIDSVFDELVQEHPLLAAITFVNTSGSVKMIVNKGGIQLAVWGKLTDSYKTELSGSIEEIDAGLYKLQAFIPVAKAMLDLGPAWLDKYIRTILSEALFFGIEKAIISGTGKDEPIGINRVVGSTSSVSAGVYSEKEAIKVTSFEPASYGALCSRLATNSESGLSRTVTGLILIVNPVDYLKVIMPATTMLTPSGVYVRDIFPVPTQVIQSQECAQGKAYLGMAKRYFMALGSARNGKIEYDDSVQFMEDNRVYAIKMYGNGMPLDNNGFITLDISELKPLRYNVTTLTETLDKLTESVTTEDNT